MEPQPFISESVNGIGIAGMIAFGACWVGSLVSWVRLISYLEASDPTAAPRPQKRPGWIGALASTLALLSRYGEVYDRDLWSNPEKRKRFLPFVGFCALGVLCGFIVVLFGGWTKS